MAEFRSVIDIDVHAEQFTAFLQAFNSYKESLDKMPKQWQSISAAIKEAATAANSLKNLNTGADQLAKSTEKVDKNLQKVKDSAKSAGDSLKDAAKQIKSIMPPTAKTSEKLAWKKWTRQLDKEEADKANKEKAIQKAKDKADKEAADKASAEQKALEKYQQAVIKEQERQEAAQKKAQDKLTKQRLAEEKAIDKEIAKTIATREKEELAAEKRRQAELDRLAKQNNKEASKAGKEISERFKGIKNDVSETTGLLQKWMGFALSIGGLYAAKKLTFDYAMDVASETKSAKSVGLTLGEKRAADAALAYGLSDPSKIVSTISSALLHVGEGEYLKGRLQQEVGLSKDAGISEMMRKSYEFLYREANKPGFKMESASGLLLKQLGYTEADVRIAQQTSKEQYEANLRRNKALEEEGRATKESSEAIQNLASSTQESLTKIQNAWTTFIGQIAPDLDVAQKAGTTFTESLIMGLGQINKSIHDFFDISFLYDDKKLQQELKASDYGKYRAAPQPTIEQSKLSSPAMQNITAGTFGASAIYNKSNFAKYEQQYGLPAGTLSKIEQLETSGGKNLSYAGQGAYGFFQMKPSTARDYGSKSMQDLYDEDKAANLAAQHMKRLLVKSKGDLNAAMTAYHSGEAILQGDGDYTTKLGPQGKIYDERVKKLNQLQSAAPAKTSSGYGFTVIQPQQIAVYNATGSSLVTNALQAATGLTQAQA